MTSTRVFTHRFCADHAFHPCITNDGVEHQESPTRITHILEALETHKLQVTDVAGSSTIIEELDNLNTVYGSLPLLVHTKDYVDKVVQACESLEETQSVPLTPRLLAYKGPQGATLISRLSYATALAATATCVQAIDWVLEASSSEVRKAFCVVRPPGHHAGPSFPDPKVGGCGFCILNHAAIAAAYAKTRLSRVAVIDFDVHHGNGTEACLEALGSGFFYGSTHLAEVFPNDPDRDYFPGTGLESSTDDGGCVIVNCPIKPLWQKPVRRKRAKTLTAGREAAIRSFDEILLPALKNFAPDIVIVSAGFDGALGDEGNLCENATRSGLDLLPGDYKYLTQKLLAISPRLVSLLEGGYGTYDQALDKYDRSLLVNCVRGHLEALCGE